MEEAALRLKGLVSIPPAGIIFHRILVSWDHSVYRLEMALF